LGFERPALVFQSLLCLYHDSVAPLGLDAGCEMQMRIIRVTTEFKAADRNIGKFYEDAYGQDVGTVADRSRRRRSVWNDALAGDEAAAFDDPGRGFG
jgi:hypothetical protein